jgi:UPF0755 protein
MDLKLKLKPKNGYRKSKFKAGPKLTQPGLKKDASKKWLKSFAIVLSLIVIIIGGAFTWYRHELRPVGSGVSKDFTISAGQGAATVFDNLEKDGLIRSSLAIKIDAKLHNYGNSLKAGTYNLSADLRPRDIASVISGGRVSSKKMTILAGKTMAELMPTLYQHFGRDEVDGVLASLTPDFNKILKDGPSTVNLEGYLMPETYTDIAQDTRFEDWLTRNLDAHYSKVAPLIPELKARGFNIHQALSLASIVQKESDTASDQKQIAQVFELRLQKNISLGSDVTFIYASKLAGIKPDLNIDSPYNTRKVKGLPPGPISTFEFSALEAVARPAAGDYLFFVAGDDGVVYYSRTDQEHEALIAEHCKKGCN